jgi:hypothetical protein
MTSRRNRWLGLLSLSGICLGALALIGSAVTLRMGFDEPGHEGYIHGHLDSRFFDDNATFYLTDRQDTIFYILRYTGMGVFAAGILFGWMFQRARDPNDGIDNAPTTPDGRGGPD